MFSITINLRAHLRARQKKCLDGFDRVHSMHGRARLAAQQVSVSVMALDPWLLILLSVLALVALRLLHLRHLHLTTDHVDLSVDASDSRGASVGDGTESAGSDASVDVDSVVESSDAESCVVANQKDSVVVDEAETYEGLAP